MVAEYILQTEAFEGPLELLLTLVEKRKLLINDIALADVADDFLNFVKQHPEFPVNETAQFVLVGSTLLLIKSKSLLPNLFFTTEEEESMEDLAVRLKQLQVYKRIAEQLRKKYGPATVLGRKCVVRTETVFAPDATMTVDYMRTAIRTVLRQLPKFSSDVPQTTVQKVVSLEHMMDHLTERVNKSMSVSFREATYGEPEKVNVIVTFLAMLELVRNGVIRVEQQVRHGDIQMHTDSVHTPHYA